RREELQQLPRVRIPRLDVLRILRVALDAPRADRDERGKACGDEIAEHLELVRLEGDTGRVGVDCNPAGTEDVVVRPGTKQRSKRDREVGDLRRVTCVAEIDDACDSIAFVEEHVVERKISVHDLRAKEWPPRDNVLLEAVDDVRNEPTALLVRDRSEQRPQLRSALEIPEQLTGRRWMEEAAQRETEAGGGRREAAPGRVGERR